jgi:hypothetical protein
MESNFGPIWSWRKQRRIENSHDALQDIHYCRFMNVQTGFEFGFESRQFSGVRSNTREFLPHLQRRAESAECRVQSAECTLLAGAVQMNPVLVELKHEIFNGVFVV